MNDLAPILIFAYKRPEHLRRTLESLGRCEGFERSPVMLHFDGPRSAADAAAVEQTRGVARAMLRSRAEFRFREANAGLAASIIDGVTLALQRFDRLIVLEDDLELAPGFLAYMNAALERYADEPRVFQVSGQIFDTPEFHGRQRALFLPFTTSWGWGTWRRAWDRFDPLALGWEQLERDRALRRRFNLDGSYDFATMLERQMRGFGDSWAIRWYWSVFRAAGVTCFPPVSLVRNTGLDGSGTHGRGLVRRFAAQPELPPRFDVELPADAVVAARDFAFIKRALWRNGAYLGAFVDGVRRTLFRLTGRHM